MGIRLIISSSFLQLVNFHSKNLRYSIPFPFRRTLTNSLTFNTHPRIPRKQVPLLSPLHKTLNTWRIAFRTACYDPHTGPRFNTKEKERQRLGRLQRQETMYGLAGDYDDN